MENKDIRLGKTLLDIAHRIKHGLNSQVTEVYPDSNGFQMRILGFIAQGECKGKIVCQKDIENEFNIKGSSVTSVLNNMEKNGYILRQEVPGDKRRKSIVISPMARQLGEGHKVIIDNYESLLQKNLSEEELSTLTVLLDKVAKNLDDMRGNNK